MADINILALINNTTMDATNVSQKSYMDSGAKSSDFNNVFENISKSYSNDNLNQNKLLATAAPTSASDFNKPNVTKSENKKQSNDASVKKNDQTPVAKDDFNHGKSDAVNNKNNDKIDKEPEHKSNKEDNQKESDNSKTNETNQSTEKAQNTENAQTEANKTITSEQVAAEAISELAKNTAADTTEAGSEGENNTKELGKTSKEACLETDLTQIKLPKDVEALLAQQNKAKIQPQTQQAILNIKVATDDSNTGKNATAAQQSPEMKAEADALLNIGATTNKQAIKEALEKSALTQDILDKTNAKVISVETSSASGGNLLNQQNAQEQGVKIALENTNSITNSAVQTNFDKTVENVQQPKELSKTDILAQIHTKLDALQDEGTTKVTIVLKPENLGKINLELINGKDGLTARMTTDSQQVKALLDKSLSELSSSLSSQGVNVNNVSVKVAETQKQSGEAFNFDQKQFQNGNQGENHAGNQQSSSNNSQQSTERGYSYFEEDNTNMTDNIGTDGIAQNTSSHAGQVDYKI